MNQVMNTILKRKSVRVYDDKEVPKDIKEAIIQAAMRAPTAGNMMLYSVIDITDQSIKDTLAKTCDNQPFIAQAPLIFLFLADYQRWFDYYIASEVPDMCESNNKIMRKPQEGDLMLACCDALIAAQNAVIAAESFGLGSCYIGDIMENYEIHKELFDLPDYTFPITLVCFGYPTEQQRNRPQPERFDKEFIVFENKYKKLDNEEFRKMFKRMEEAIFKDNKKIGDASNIGQLTYNRKFASTFSLEMNRSVKEAIKNWRNDSHS